MSKNFLTEREGQIHFFKNFGINVDENDVLIANTDSVHNGNIFEFKLNISTGSKRKSFKKLFNAIHHPQKLENKNRA